MGHPRLAGGLKEEKRDTRPLVSIPTRSRVDASTVVAMSVGGSATDVQLMLELGAHDFVPKGPELRGRVTKIATMLAKRQ